MVKIHYTPEWIRRFQAIRACWVLGPAAMNLLPELRANVDYPKGAVAHYSLFTIMRVKGELESIPELLAGLTHTNDVVRGFSVHTFKDFAWRSGTSLSNFLTVGVFDPNTAAYISNQVYKVEPSALNPH